MAGPSKNPFVNVTLGSVVMGVLGYLSTHVSGPNAALVTGGLTLVSYFLGGIFHRNPAPPPAP